MNSKLSIRKLSWAGVLLESDGQRLVIDGLEGRDGVVQKRIGPNRLPLLPFTNHHIDYALITHHHFDHFDADALRRGVIDRGGRVVAPTAVAPEISSSGITPIMVDDRSTLTLGPFRVTPMPAVDGFGAPQSSWIVETQGVQIFHGGDTLFHGYWWEIAKRTGGVDVAFLPINGARIAIPGLEATGLPGIMNAEEASVAARVMKAKLAVPIHYAEFHYPPVYIADLDAEKNFLAYAAREKVSAQIFAAGEIVLSRG